jgi:hypothetical protein
MKNPNKLIALLFLSGCATPNNNTTVENLIQQINEANKPIIVESNKTYYQAYDVNYPDTSPVFLTKGEAEQYLIDNNFTDNNYPTGHNYIVRPIHHRYEVYLKNDVADDLLYESSSFDIAEEYVDFYKDSHSDIVIYDLIEQEFVTNK